VAVTLVSLWKILRHKMKPRIFAIKACSNAPIENDWGAQLVTLLGSKPRRLSRWCELGLYGALLCIKQSGQTDLSSDVAIRVYSEYATINATRMAMEQATEHLPMPFTFMQTQPCQIFNALGAAVGWHGDGYVTSSMNRHQSEVALLQDIQQSALLACVDEVPEPISRWIWLEEVKPKNELNWEIADSVFQTSEKSRWLKIDSRNMFFQSVE
jgi:hypothetical protein